MRLIHRGVTVDIPDTDVRVAMIEALIFSQALPGPLTVVAPLPAADDAVPAQVRDFWNAMSAVAKKELLLLAGRRFTALEIEAALGVSQPRLTSIHARISRVASEHGVDIGVKKIGRVRADRRYELKGEDASYVSLFSND